MRTREPTRSPVRPIHESHRAWGRRDADKLLAQLVAKLDTEGPTTRQTLNELLTAHIDHLDNRGREVRTIEGYRSIATQVANDKIGKTVVAKIGVKVRR